MVFKTIKLFSTNDRLQLIKTLLEYITLCPNQSKIIKILNCGFNILEDFLSKYQLQIMKVNPSQEIVLRG